MELTGRAFSKLNLFLKVTGRRPDHYHELETLFLPLREPADWVTIRKGEPGVRVRSSLAGLPENLENIAGRAALAYAEAAGIPAAFSLFIDKHVPVAAGMGGGSADAGAVLRMLQDHYHALSSRDLSELALTLGADVPFFLHPRLAVATGVGEVFRYPEGEFSPPPILIVNPGFPVSAKWAYTHLDVASIGPSPADKLECLLEGLRLGDAAQVAMNLHNDLAPALYRKFPFLQLLKNFMINHGALNVEVTGSGPTLYAICETVNVRAELGAQLRSRFSPDAISVWDDIPLSFGHEKI